MCLFLQNASQLQDLGGGRLQRHAGICSGHQGAWIRCLWPDTFFFKALHHLGCYIHTRALYGVCEKLEIYPTVFGSLKP